MNKRKFAVLLVLPLLFACFLSVGLSSAETAGNTNVEANGQYIFNQYLRAFQINITEPATITRVSFYSTGSVGVNCSASLYYGNYVSPANLIETAFSLSVDGDWMNFTFNEVVDAGSYWVAIGTETNDAVGGVRNVELTGLAGFCGYTWANFPNPFGTFSGENYVWSVFITYTPYVEPTPSPSPSPTPEGTATPTSGPTVTGPIATTELVLIAIWLVFTVLAFAIKEPFIFAIAALISLILGLDLGLIYLGDSAEWIFGIIGFAIMMFGIFQMLIAMTIKKGVKQR